MTKKHFKALAENLYYVKPNEYNEGGNLQFIQWLEDCQAIADVCAQFNPQFDRDRFIHACSSRNKSSNIKGGN
jgi:hypothetical protein